MFYVQMFKKRADVVVRQQELPQFKLSNDQSFLLLKIPTECH
jgi:hypothetical protein